MPDANAPAAGQDMVLIVILLAVMAFFLLRNLAKFKSDGMAVSRHKKDDDEEDEDEEEEEEEEEEDDSKDD